MAGRELLFEPKFPITFEGNNTQNATWQISNLTGVAVGYIPRYHGHQLWMTESIGSGIIMSIVVAQLCQQFATRTVGKGCTWVSTCAVNSFVYTITVVMMGTSSAIFNPAVMFGWAILGRTSFKIWIMMFVAQVWGGTAGTLCAWSQFIQQLARVPIPRKDKNGKFIYVQVDTWQWKYCWWPCQRGINWLLEAKPAWSKRPVPWYLGGKAWEGPEYRPHDFYDDTTAMAYNPAASSDSPSPSGKASNGGGTNSAAAAAEDGAFKPIRPAADAVSSPLEWYDTFTEEDQRLMESEEYQAELRRDQKAKLMCFAETPHIYSPFFIYCWWPHMMAGTTLVHWLSFMTGNATQLTNTNMYLTQPTNGTPGANYSFLNGVLLAWLFGLAYFLLTASAGGVCTLQLNPASDLAGRIVHWLAPIPNKGHSGWSYAWVPMFFPFCGATVGAAIMNMSMWSELYFPFRPYGTMRQWWGSL